MLPPPPPGYSDLSLCGVGATSRVFRATQENSGRVVALKRLHRQLVRSPEALARLRRELECVATLQHPSIVPFFDVFSWEGDPTLVLRYIPGEDLKARIESGPMPVLEVERIARILFEVLSVVHGAGIVHRDLKPQNVRLEPTGNVYLLDFGSARLDAASQLTTTGTTVGTPHYMPPELFDGPVYDPRVDLYGLGATMFECLTGRPPQLADSIAELARDRCTKPVPPISSLRSDVPMHLAQVIDRCLSIRPEDRYASATLALWALDHAPEERAFRLRRAQLPPCLHCATPLAATASLCPRCKSARPFAYSPGLAHVEVTSVREPSRLIEHVATLLPERADTASLLELSEHAAYLSFGTRRYVSFVDRAEADKIAHDLERAGVRATVSEELSSRSKVLIGVLFVLSVVLGVTVEPWAIPLFFAGVLLERGLSLIRGRQSILASSLYPKTSSPAVQQVALFGMLGTAAAMIIAPEQIDRLAFPHAGLLSFGSMLGLYLVSSFTGSWSSFGKGTAEPPLGMQAAMAMGIAKPLAYGKQRSKGIARLHRAAGPALLVAMTALVPIELYTLSEVGLHLARSLNRADAYQIYYKDYGPFLLKPGTPGNIAQNGRAPAFELEQLPSLPELEERVRGHGRPVERRRTAAVESPKLEKPRSFWEQLERAAGPIAGSIIPVLSLFLIAHVLRRRMRIAKDGRATFEELDHEHFAALADRTSPLDRHHHEETSSDVRVAGLGGHDLFVQDAIRRASDLAQLLPPRSVERLRGAITAMDRPQHSEARAESLLARCIMETDESYRLRFEFLALEGRLEAESALAWAERLKRR